MRAVRLRPIYVSAAIVAVLLPASGCLHTALHGGGALILDDYEVTFRDARNVTVWVSFHNSGDAPTYSMHVSVDGELRNATGEWKGVMEGTGRPTNYPGRYGPPHDWPNNSVFNDTDVLPPNAWRNVTLNVYYPPRTAVIEEGDVYQFDIRVHHYETDEYTHRWAYGSGCYTGNGERVELVGCGALVRPPPEPK